MRGFIEVHGPADRVVLINANGIEYVAPYGLHVKIQMRSGRSYCVKEDLKTVKALVIEALTPSFTVMKEGDDDRS